MAKHDDGGARRLFEKLGAAGASKHAFTGMVKPAEDDQSIMMARAGDCAKWVQIPARYVQDVEFIQLVHCGDHTHPLVHVFMKEPDSAEAKAFAAVASLHQGPSHAVIPPMTALHPSTMAMTASHPATMTPHSNLVPGATPCYWDVKWNRWVC
jgi:hypothetical protein